MSNDVSAGATAAPPAHKVADPGPLGLAAFAMTTFALSLWNANVWSPAVNAALALALVYGGAAQVFAGMWEFARRNTFGALAFTSYGAFWISFYVLVKFIMPGVKPADAGTVVGVFLLGWTIFTAYMFISTFRLSVILVVVFGLLVVTFVLLTVGNFQSMSGWVKAGGWFGIATAAAAWYASFAGVTNETFGKTVLPTGPLSR